MSIDTDRDAKGMRSIMYNLEILVSLKPNDRSDMDRVYAIVITEIEGAAARLAWASMQNASQSQQKSKDKKKN